MYFEAREYIPCDLCGEDDYGIFINEKLKRSIVESDFSVFGEQCEHPRLVKCRKCGLIYANPRDYWNDLEKKYDGLNIDGYISEEQSRRLTAQACVELVKRYVENGKVLDIGCSAGFFLDSLPDSFEPYGVEPGAEAACIAKQLIGEKAVYHGFFDDIAYEDEFFDVITLWDVIEHLPSPKGTLMKTKSILKKGGFLFIATPDVGSLFARLMGKQWPHFIRQHLYYFNRKTLPYLLKSCGFKRIYQSTFSRKFKLGYILRRARPLLFSEKRIKNMSEKKILSRILNATISIDLGDMILLVAKKIE
ncbi:MAG: methyltransferase domain-containing protein [Deltaproteobacteria bacterium]|nr:methyltransferase domain-containing protein [Candidatus Zymogenaceae bacterium]